MEQMALPAGQDAVTNTPTTSSDVASPHQNTANSYVFQAIHGLTEKGVSLLKFRVDAHHIFD